MPFGEAVYQQHCASCHGDDLRGNPALHAPNLVDADWTFTGDDLATGGNTMFPSDVEWTVRYGVRTEHENARGLYANMVAYDPNFRSEEDAADFGRGMLLNRASVADVVEYVLKISGQEHDAAAAIRGDEIFHERGGCFDCHSNDGTALGSTNLTKKELYLYGSDRQSISTSILEGRRSTMPAFQDTLKPEEIKAVSVFVWSRAAK
jgi:cytochrome c oxidase cbb3-type subunit 3